MKASERRRRDVTERLVVEVSDADAALSDHRIFVAGVLAPVVEREVCHRAARVAVKVIRTSITFTKNSVSLLG